MKPKKIEPSTSPGSFATPFHFGDSQEWGDSIQKLNKERNSSHLSVLIFRLNEVWLALETIFVKQVILNRSIHTIPHRNKNLLLGIINYNGRLEICVTLAPLLQIKCDQKKASSSLQRMLILQHQKKVWVTPVDEIKGIFAWDLTYLEKFSSKQMESHHHLIKNSKHLSTHWVGLLDGNFLFQSIENQSLQNQVIG